MSFSKILIANRGEIAVRVIRTAKAMGYRTVAVFSEADANAMQVRLADEAVCIGPAPAAQSYLNIAALLDAARRSGADAVHPGYGFLSENATFASACMAAGLVFIGPPPAVIEAMGSKSTAKRLMSAAGVPCLAGYLGEAQDDATLTAAAAKLGYPLLVKAVAGGGGRGMRRVDAAEALTAALSGARREALAAFGDGTLMLEAWVGAGRHIEVQVFGDAQGQIIHLGERDCTTQRRRQKLIEEAPAPGLSGEQRYALCTDALRAAQTVNYVGAGTVEFMLDAQGRHYFLEMNTRLQVEHPVTEMVTGLDLVEWQLRVAAGEPLPLSQEQIRIEGHAVEVRLYAEDPFDGFRPHSGTVAQWLPSDQVRVDSGVETGSVVGPHYDALLAKLIVHAPEREQARRRLAMALEELPPLGLIHNARLLRDLLLSDEFLHTATLDTLPLLTLEPQPRDWLSAAALLTLSDTEPRPLSVARYGLTLECGSQRRSLRIRPGQIEMDGVVHQVAVLPDGRIDIDGLRCKPLALKVGGTLHLSRDAAQFTFSEPAAAQRQAANEDGRSPVTGLVSQVLVKAGDQVSAGQPLLSVEAMKMEMWISAPHAGRVKSVLTAAGASVSRGSLLVEMETEGTTE